MINNPKTPKLLSEVTAGDFPSPTEAGHNKDGMYTMRASEPGKLDAENMVQLESGLWVEKPDEWKPIRVLWLDGGSGLASIECDESYDELKAIVAHAQAVGAKAWYEVTDPAFGHKVALPASVLAKPVFITTQYKDMEAIKDQLKQQQLQQRMARLQTASQEKSAAIVQQYKRSRQN